MDRQLKCFLSSSFDTDVSVIKSVLAENGVEIFNLYDFAIGDSIQQILKRKLRQSDFAIFVISKENKNILYEIGVCEGLGKESLIIIDKDADLPFYLENKLSLSVNLNDRDFLKLTLLGFIEEIESKRKPSTRNKPSNTSNEIQTYNDDISSVLESLLEQTRSLRLNGNGKEAEYIIEEIFKTINVKYVDNTSNSAAGIDFAIWSDKLGKILGNPIIVEIKCGLLRNETIKNAEHQIRKYADKSDAKVALLLYLDKAGKRFNITPSLKPLILAYDIEDFISELLKSNFENVILTGRNKLAHGN